MTEGRFGSAEGAGLESIAAGGLYSLFIDENGTVRDILYPFNRSGLILLLGLVVWDERRCCSRKNTPTLTIPESSWTPTL